MRVSRVLYKPVGLVLGLGGGVLAGAVFKRTWRMLGHDDDAPDAMDQDRTWREVLVAAAVQGAVFAVVKAAVERSGAAATRRLTGTWPG